MKKVLATLLSVMIVVSSISMLFTLSAGAVPTNLLNNGDFETPTGVSNSAYGENDNNYIPGCYAATPVTDPKFTKWFRIGDGNETYHNSIQVDPDNSANHVGKVAQSLLQGGVLLENGKKYDLSFRAKATAVTGTPITQQYVSISIYDATTNVAAGVNAATAVKENSISATVTNSAGTPAAGNVTQAGTSPKNFMYAPLYQDDWYTYNISFTVPDDAIVSGNSYGIAFSANSSYSSSWYYMFIDDVVLAQEGAQTTTFTVGATATAGGTASVDKTSVASGESVTFTATPDQGYTFDGWYKDGVLYNENASFTEVITADTSYEARFEAEGPVSTDPNCIPNGNFGNVGDFLVTGGNTFTFSGFAGKHSGTGSTVVVGEATDLPDGTKSNNNVINFTLDSSATTSSATICSSNTYTLKENTYYEASVWVKTSNLYGFKFYLYEPTYTDRLNVPGKYSLYPVEGQNVYSFSYINASNPTTRVARKDIPYLYKANGVATDNAGTGSASMCYLRTGTQAEKDAGIADTNGYYEPSLKYGTETNGWVKVTMSFKTKSGLWTKDTAGSEATDLPYAVPIALGVETRPQAVKAGNISTLSFAGFGLYESFDISASVPEDAKGGYVSVNGVSGLNVSAPVASGNDINLVATPFAGNSFVGWYDSTDALLTTELTYTTPATGNTSFIAKFNNTSGNLFNNPGFEGYADGTVLSVGGGTKSTDGWSNGSASWMNNTVTSAKVYSGARALRIANTYNDGAAYQFEVEPNTSYVVNLKWWLPLNVTTGTSHSHTLSYIKVTDTAGASLSGADNFAFGTGNWEDLTISFNSGSNTTVKLAFRAGYAPTDNLNNLHVDDITIFKSLGVTVTTATTGASTVEGGAASASKTSVLSGESVTFTAKAYKGNVFNGWFKDGVLYKSDLTFTETITDNIAYEARFTCLKPNLLSESGFESYPLGAFFNVPNPTADPPVVAINPNWTGSATWGTGAIVNTYAASGTKSLKLSQRHNTSTRKVTGLKANTDYEFTFMYFFTDKVESTSAGTSYNMLSYAAVTLPNYVYGFGDTTGGIGPVGTSANGTVLAKTIDYKADNTVYGTWAPITITFNTGDNTAVDLHIRYASDDVSGATSALYIDEMSLLEASTAPTNPTVTHAGYTAGAWTKNDVTFTVSGATYLDGIAKYQYSTNGTDWTDITDTNGTITKDGNNVTQVVFTASASGDYSFRAVTTDNRTTAATTAVSVKIDKVVPVVSVSTGSYTAGTWTKDNVTFTLSNTAANTSSVSYKYTTNGTVWLDVNGTTLTISADTVANYQFKAVSQAGVESAVSTETAVKVQKTAPANATVVLNPEDPDVGDFYTTAPTITITAPTITGTAPVKTYYKLWTGATEPQDGIEFTGSNQPSITADGKYTLKVWTVDEAGNQSTVTTIGIKVDANASDFLPGDINGDGEVDLKDVTTLSRYIAGWNGLTVVEAALDTNGDGEIDLKDVTLLSRYIAGWNVVLGGGRIPL